MVLLIKKKHASFEDFTRLSDSSAGDTPRWRLAKLGMQSLRSAGIPKAKSMPHINLLAKGASLKARCTAVLNADLHKLKPRELIARKVKSAKEDLAQLFDDASPKQHVEPAREPSDLTSIKPACSTTASNVDISSSLDPSSPSARSVLAPSDEPEEDEDHVQCLVLVAQRWLDFERLFSRRRALFDHTIEEARRDFCQALVQSFADCSPTASPLQAPQSCGNLVALPLSSSPVASTAPSAVTLADQTTVSPCTPEFSDEDLKREWDNFSFHSSQGEGWTSEVESRKQNAMNQALSDMKRKLAVPVPKLSSYFSDDSLADSAAHRTLVNPRVSCSGTSSGDADGSSFYSADQEDEAEEDDGFVAVSCSDSPVSTATVDVDATIVPTCPVELSLSSPTDDPTSDEKQDCSDPRATDIADGTDDVWEILATYVPRLLTSISEESLADEYEIEATGQFPPLSFQRPISQYRKVLPFGFRDISHLDCTIQTNATPAVPLAEGTGSSDATSSNVETSATTADTGSDPSLSSVLNPGKTLRRVKKFMDLKNPVRLPTVQSTLSIETISLHDGVYPPESRARRLRRVPGCLNLRKAFGGTDISTETPPSLSGTEGRCLQSLGRRSSFKEWHRSSDLEGCDTQPIPSRCHTLTREDSARPPIPPKPPGFCLDRKRNQVSSAATQESSSLCSRCDPSSSLPLWSCAKITRSKGKRGRPPNESTMALKKRLDSIHIDPETIHGHPPQRRREKLPSLSSVSESRKAKTSKIVETPRKISTKAILMQNVENQKISKNKKAIFRL